MLKGSKKSKVVHQKIDQPEITIRNPREILWLHHTISPTFSQGAPDPTPDEPNRKKPGRNVLAVANDLKKGTDPDGKKISYQDFPALEVFTLEDPDSREQYTYSLSNRRLTAMRASGISEVKTQPAPFSKIYASLWKMTSLDGGFSQPQSTQLEKGKELRPAKHSTLGKFRDDMEEGKRIYEARCRSHNIVDQNLIDARVIRKIEGPIKTKYRMV